VDEKGNLPDRPLYRIPEALALGNYTVSRWLVEAVIMLCTQPPLPPTTTHRILMVFLSKIDGANPPVFPSRDLCDACTRSKILHCPRNPDVDYRYRRSSPWVLEGNCGACTSAWTAQVLQFSARCASRVVQLAQQADQDGYTGKRVVGDFEETVDYRDIKMEILRLGLSL